MECADDAIVGTTPAGVINSWNAAAERIVGYTREEAIGRPISLLIPPERRAQEKEIIHKLREGAYVDRIETTWLSKDHRKIPVSLAVSSICNSTGAVVGFLKIARDISQQKQACEILKEVTRRNDEFIAILAHELRNPLASIRNAIQLSSTSASATSLQQEARAMLERQVGHLTRLVDDLMDMSRITQQKMSLSQWRVDLNESIRAAIDTNRYLIDVRRQHLQTTFLSQSPLVVEGDPVRLLQIFGNLLNNAAKYTEPEGNILVLVKREANEAVVCVQDNGVGISAEYLPRIFDLFTQASCSLDKAQGGLGIGLSLVKSLVELHRGTIEAHSVGIGAGSRFVVRLPLLSAEENSVVEPPKRSMVNGEPMRILVVDDDKDAVEGMSALLQLQGHQTCTAQSGIAALEVAGDFRPNIVLLDIELPNMDGFEVARRLRKNPETARCIILALTGYGDAENMDRSKDAGFDDYLVKPVEPERLKAIIASAGRSLDSGE